MFSVQKVVSKYGEMLIAPLLIVIGVYMLDIIKLNLPKINFSGNNLKRKTKGSWGALYFGMLMPMSAAETGGYLLPVVYAIATGLPVILVAWVLAYSVAGLGKLYNRIQVFEKWLRKVIAILFIAVGIYYAVMYYL